MSKQKPAQLTQLEQEKIKYYTSVRIQLEQHIRDLKSQARNSIINLEKEYEYQAIIKLMEAKMWIGQIIGSIEGYKSPDIDYFNNEIKPKL